MRTQLATIGKIEKLMKYTISAQMDFQLISLE